MIAPPPPPPAPHELPAGTQLVAGLGASTVLPDLDFETYSEAGFIWNPGRGKWDGPPGASGNKRGLPVVGAAVYAQHPTAEVLTCSYDLKDGRGVRRWRPGLPLPQDLFNHLAAGGLLESHNCGFERWIWNEVCVRKYGWPPLQLEQQRCSMAKARAHGWPGALEDVQKVRGGVPKDPRGKRLLDRFSVPRAPTRKDPRLRIRPEEDPEGAEELYQYCDGDIRAESDVSAAAPDLSPDELAWWLVDQKINYRGVRVDMPLVEAGIAITDEVLRRGDAELYRLTGGAVARASELSRLATWLAETCDVRMPSMDEESITAWLAGNNTPPEAVRALQIRQACAAASVKKLYSVRIQAARGDRLHDLFNYHAARTGRATGSGPQPTNFPNSGPNVLACACGRHYRPGRESCPWCGAATPAGAPLREWSPEAADDAIELVMLRSPDLLADAMGDPLQVLSGTLRGIFIASEGHELVSSDYTAIEAVVLAMLAGEQWRIDLFRQGGKIYEASGAKITGIDYDYLLAHAKEHGQHHPARQKGKIAELALGYAGWIGALIAFGAEEWMTEPEMKELVQAWRAANPNIVQFWGGQYRGLPWETPRRVEYFGLEGAAIQAVRYPGQPFETHGIGYVVVGDILYCTLPSGRRLAYHRPRLRPNERDRWGDSLALSFEGWNTNPKKGAYGWIRMDLYGGVLTENVCQATARDILTHATVRLWGAGYKTVLHVYDEIVAEVPVGTGSLEEFEAIMGDLPAWAAGWPVRAQGGWRGHRYRK